MLRVINGALSDCGSSSSYQLEHADGERAEDADCDLNEAGQLKQTNGHVAVGDGKTFVLGEALRCTYTPGITPQSTCNVSLGVVPSDVPVGFYALCGCSSTDLGASGRPCSSNEDFSVPVGLLRITGFEAPATVDFDPDVSPASAAVAGSTLASTAGSNSTASHKNVKLGSTEATKEVAPPLEIRKGGAAVEARETIDDTEPLQILLSIEDQKKLLLPSFSCIVGLPCELPSIKGVGLVSTEHFVRAFPGVYPSCQAASETSTPLRLPCRPISAGSRCIVHVRPEDMKAIMQSRGQEAAKGRKNKGSSGVGELEVLPATATLCGCRAGPTALDCLGATLVGLLHLQAGDGQYSRKQLQQTRQHKTSQEQQLQQHQPQQQQLQQKQRPPPPPQLRKLQFIEDRAANLPKEPDPSEPEGSECRKHADCLRGYGRCVSGRCRGFIPDLKGERLIRCVEGYHCDAEKGDIPTKGEKENFMVIGIGPDEECGASVNLKPDSSIFSNANKWVCSSSPSSSCEMRFGVARRLSRANTVEGVRLCGCPGVDNNGDELPCNHMRDFRVPIGRVSVQECLTNAHCADRQLAYCIKDHCGGFLVSAAAASVNAFACVRNQDCTLENVAARGVTEALKVIPIAAHLKCGPEAALDPNFLPESAMPCVADVDGDGKCDVHLGVNHFFGTHRLCGCSGGDCDDPSDFGVELGLLNSVECVVHSDCPIHALCAKGECVSDDLPPNLVASDPAPHSVAIPPLKQIQLQFNEDIVFGRPGASLIVQCLDPEIKWVITLPEGIEELKVIRYSPPIFPKAHRRTAGAAGATTSAGARTAVSESFEESSGSSKWLLERQGQILTVTPDEELSSLPQGSYKLSIEFGFVTDLTGNPSDAVPFIPFRVAKDGGCPLLYVTGFGTENGNCNGLYTPIDPLNGHAGWRGAEGNAFFIYYRKETDEEPGNWVIDTDLDEGAFLAFADVSLLQGFPRGEKGGPQLPPTGLWHKWTGKKREEQPFAAFVCREKPDHLPPTLIDVKPAQGGLPGSGGFRVLKLNNETGLSLEPITLVFNKPINYGHWASLRLTARGEKTPVAEWVTDQEAGMRGPTGSVLIRSPQPSSSSTDHQTSDHKLASESSQDEAEREEEHGVVELSLQAPLEAGKEYDLTADLGAFTDLSYNPWGPLASQTVTFSAVATHCRLLVGAAAATAAAEAAEPDGPEAQATAGDETSYELLVSPAESVIESGVLGRASRVVEGAVAFVHCVKGLSVPLDLIEGGDSQNAGELRCTNGRWQGALTPCVPRCRRYPQLADAYDLEESAEAIEGISGSAVVVRCADAAAASDGRPQQTLRCLGGRWEPLTLKCSALCPPLGPFLGPGYLVTLSHNQDEANEDEGEDAATAAAAEGEERIVRCIESTVPEQKQEQQILRCTEDGWAPSVTLNCRRSCRQPPITPAGAELRGEGVHHGSVWIATCKEGYAGPVGGLSLSFTCEDGQWVRENGSGSPPFACSPLCPPLNLNRRAYTVTSIESAAPSDATAAAVKIACAEDSLLLGGPSEEILRCEGGLWSLRSTTCAAGCRNPLDDLGEHYVLVRQQQQQQQIFKHGDTAEVTCSGGQQHNPLETAAIAIEATKQSHTITCVDGRWESQPDAQKHRQQSHHDNLEDPVENATSSSSDGVLLRCSATCSLPPLPAHFAIIFSTKRGVTRRPRKFLWREGEKISVGCSPHFDSTQRQQQQQQQQPLQQLECLDGTWAGNLPKDMCVRQCPGASGSPSEAQWREWGVRCGESCSSSCGSCYNRKRDRDEEGIDCGGPFCEPCSSCSPLLLKQFVMQPRLFSTSLKKLHQKQQQQPEVFPVEMTRHGSSIRFSCNSSASLSLKVTCDNGSWITGAAAGLEEPAAADEAARIAAFAAACTQTQVMAVATNIISGEALPRAISAAPAGAERRADEELLLLGSAAIHGDAPPLQWREAELLLFGPPILRAPQLEVSPSFQQQQHQQRRLSPCMQGLVDGVSRLLVGECGALAFGRSALKVASFCKGTCNANFKRALQEATECSSKTASAAAPGNAPDSASASNAATLQDEELLQLFKDLLQVFCSVEDGKHCFSQAGDTLEQLQRLHQTAHLQQQLRQHMCPGSSGNACFNSNIRYVSLLQQLREHVDLMLPGMQQEQQQQSPANAAAAAAVAGDSKELEESVVGAGVRGLLTDLRRLPAVISLLCTEVDGKSCAFQVLALGGSNPFAALPVRGAAAEFCSSDPTAPCLLEVYRLVGKELLRPHLPNHIEQLPLQKEQQLLLQQVHPHDWAIGTAMQSIGRNFCLRSAEDKTCGALLVPAESVSAAPALGAVYPYEPAAAADLPQCHCPLAFVGDGDCDITCNTAACAFDKGDCLAQRQPLLQPIVDTLEEETFSRDSPCFPFSKAFHCVKKECRQEMQELQAQHGCCIAPQLELLRDLLYIDHQQREQQRHQLALLQQQMPDAVTPHLLRLVESLWGEMEGTSGPMELYRSVAFIEADCKMPLDRTCSRGLNRTVFAVDATLEGLNYDALKASSDGSSSGEGEEALRHVLRDVLSGALGIPVGDVLLVRTWEGLDVHALIDAGPLSNKAHFLQAVDRLRKDGPTGLAALLSAELQRQQAAIFSAAIGQQQYQQQLQKQQSALGPLLLHPIPLLPAAALSPHSVFVPPDSVSISQIAFASPGSSSSNSSGSSRRQQQQLLLLRPEKGTWGLGRLPTRDVSCNTNDGLSAPLNVSVFEAYRLHSNAATNEHGSIITVECGRGYSPVAGSSPQELICQQGRWSPLVPAVGRNGPQGLHRGSLGGPRERILRCRKPCGPYEASDPAVLGPAFIASGAGEADGDRRTIYCASGFVAAADMMPKTETVACSNGVWGKRQLKCIKDFAAIAETSPCAIALSQLPPTLKVDSLPTAATSHEGPAGAAFINSDVAQALAATFQRAGVSLQLFRVGCARGFVSTSVQRKQQPQLQQQQPFTYAACKDGRLLDLGPREPLPMGAFASGEAAEALAQQLKLRVDSAPEAITSAEAAQTTEGAAVLSDEDSTSAAAVAFVESNVEGASLAATGSKGSNSMKGSTPMLLGAALKCQRELRQEPPKPPKPVSDTLLVFSCLLLLFVLVVALLALWWLRARRRQKRAAKLQQQQQQDEGDAGPTSSDIGRDFLSPAGAEEPSIGDMHSAAAETDPYRGPLPPQPLRHGTKTNAAPAIYATGAYEGTPLPCLLEAGQQQQQRRQQRPAAFPPVFPSEEAGAAAASTDDNCLAFYAPVYYTGLTGDKGLVREEGDSNSFVAAVEEEPKHYAYPEQQQQHQRKLLQQHAADASDKCKGNFRQMDMLPLRGNRPGAVNAAYTAAPTAEQKVATNVVAARAAAAAGVSGWEPQGVTETDSLPTYSQREALAPQQQQQLQHTVSRRGKSLEEIAHAVFGESSIPSAGIPLSEEDELYPEDSASCMVMAASQRRESAVAAAVAPASGSPRWSKQRGRLTRQHSASHGHGRNRGLRSFPQGDMAPGRHIHA
ncbi:sushi domain-containing protein / SCR repeat-containing protein, putative [Eimeria tenella]|uniref:Sushi domain-containing protein / SCR repeat-containing protein, putative n=1 Tax=Eimeria tenella TaxID=5802 RepID=U6KYI2_EIMTE|nr:sushi domain-containing protein / SCR repeat-containing protein, putative [Eimeria tenella]CDJ40550.1 sushi domain-containing protein / SCR repeat-containing protein, putative [Eimeria tenella]|eukprot:XP_013231300.1 sushi domain-containing protein / SCR repeat-containing protein, putative [Eimeria tenella]